MELKYFIKAFKDCGREDHFSITAMKIIHDYFDWDNPELELDVEELCEDIIEAKLEDWKSCQTPVIGTYGDMIIYFT
jgi:hypothetical protein